MNTGKTRIATISTTLLASISTEDVRLQGDHGGDEEHELDQRAAHEVDSHDVRLAHGVHVRTMAITTSSTATSDRDLSLSMVGIFGVFRVQKQTSRRSVIFWHQSASKEDGLAFSYS